MTKGKGSPPRWTIAAVALAGLLVDISTIVWLWTSVPITGQPTGVQVAMGAIGAVVAASLMALAVALGVVRTRG